MRILVFVKNVPDTKIPLVCDGYTGRLRDGWNVPMLNPPDRSALEGALRIKKHLPETEITVIHLGPPSGEQLLRSLLALGCDEGLRVWDHGLDEIHAVGKALIFARIAKIAGFDLILTGVSSQDTNSAQIGLLLASHLALPSVNAVTDFEISQGAIRASKRLSQGYHERVEALLPAVVAMDGKDTFDNYAPLPDLLETIKKEIPCYDLSRIGIPTQAIRYVEDRLHFGPLRLPASALRFVPAPDFSLPGFLRIKRLIEGAVARREGHLVTGEGSHVAEQLFQTLLKGGWLDHLREGRVDKR